MPELKVEIRKGSYYDSITLMQLQASLLKLPGIRNAGVMLATDANKQLLQQQNLLNAAAGEASGTDLIISIHGEDKVKVEAALGQVDDLLTSTSSHDAEDYLPKSLETAIKMLPEARWILISVPGSYAAGLAREGLGFDKNIFLYSDNVSLKDERSLKKEAAEKGLLVMGPDCGTAIINGIGLGFANKVRRGPIGLIGASGTGLQHVMSRIHQLGSGITHAMGTGGRDLSAEVGGITARQAFELLIADDDTRVIILISKPPAPEVAATLLRRARTAGKHVVVNFIGFTSSSVESDGNVHFANSLDAAAEIAVQFAESSPVSSTQAVSADRVEGTQGYLRGLFSGGTLAYETLLLFQTDLPNIYSNVPLRKEQQLPDPMVSQEHTILDLGEDVFTVGRPHPMLDNTLRLQCFVQEARDPEVGLILLDVVLGFGSHPDPASELAPVISEAISSAKKDGRELEVIALVVGTDEDPQNFAEQIEKLKNAGARTETSIQEAAKLVVQRFRTGEDFAQFIPSDLSLLKGPLRAINIGVQVFAESLEAQEATVVHVDWRPPASGDEKLMSILERMKHRPPTD